MKKIITLIIVVTISTISFSQVSGYMGKRHELSYSFYTFPYLNNIGERIDNDDYPSFKARNNISYTYVVSSRQKLGISFELYKATTKTPYGESALFENNNSYYVENTIRTDYFETNVKSIGIDYYKYFKEWIAPLGTYSRFSLSYTFFSIDKDQINTLYNFPLVRNLEGKAGFLSAFYSLGVEKIYNDCIALDFGTQFGLNTGEFRTLEYIFIGNNSTNSNEYLTDEIKIGVARALIMNLYVKVGFLF